MVECRFYLRIWMLRKVVDETIFCESVGCYSLRGIVWSYRINNDSVAVDTYVNLRSSLTNPNKANPKPMYFIIYMTCTSYERVLVRKGLLFVHVGIMLELEFRKCTNIVGCGFKCQFGPSR